jgi:hypothetical protein
MSEWLKMMEAKEAGSDLDPQRAENGEFLPYTNRPTTSMIEWSVGRW